MCTLIIELEKDLTVFLRDFFFVHLTTQVKKNQKCYLKAGTVFKLKLHFQAKTFHM